MEKQIEEKKNGENEIVKEASSSIELKRTTRGTGFTVKIYSSDADADVDRISKKAQSVFDNLNEKYNKEEP